MRSGSRLVTRERWYVPSGFSDLLEGDSLDDDDAQIKEDVQAMQNVDKDLVWETKGRLRQLRHSREDMPGGLGHMPLELQNWTRSFESVGRNVMEGSIGRQERDRGGSQESHQLYYSSYDARNWPPRCWV